MKLPPFLLGLLGLAAHTSAYPGPQAYSDNLNLQQIEGELQQVQIQLPSVHNLEFPEDSRDDDIDVIADPEDRLPSWKEDYYAALDTLDDDLAVSRRAVPVELEQKVPLDSKLVKRKGGGAAGKPKDSGTKWYKPWKKSSPPSLETGSSASKGTNNRSPHHSDIYPRKGGGGRGGSGGKTTGGKTTSGTKKTSPGTSKDSNVGGLSKGGTGPPPKYNKYYSGGVGTPYSAGKKSPGGLSPVALPLAVVGGLFAGVWLSNVWMYAWNHPLNYYHPPTAAAMGIPYQNHTTNGNGTAVTDMTYKITPGMNVTLPVKCLCEENSVCGCDEVNDADYSKSVLEDAARDGGKGDTARLAVDDGGLVLVVNGTLPNGTTADGGNDYSSRGVQLQVGRGLVGGWTMAWVGLVVGGAVLGEVV
ncbi:hypothetical protein EV426DRAFT_664322 [Tirmania nivea]|nr:hypothetical protein EV426DRAFT_664322 [Tirmania nivea]